jgi:hypothetical protein
MKSLAKIEIFQPGIVIFDPVALKDFVVINGVASNNLFDCFLNDKEVGVSVVEKGVVFPLYQIPEMEYSVFLKGAGKESSFNDSAKKFCYSGIPLKVVSGLIVVADFSSLMDWDGEFFLNYRKACVDSLGNNDYLDVESGLYDLSISGFKGLKAPFVSLGYELGLKPVEQLPKFSIDASTDEWSFSIA